MTINELKNFCEKNNTQAILKSGSLKGFKRGDSYV